MIDSPVRPVAESFDPRRQILPVAPASAAAGVNRFKHMDLARGLRGKAATGVDRMTTTTASPYASLPQVNQSAVLPSPQQPQPQASAAGRRSFRSFVEAMDDFGFDRRDVAGMRQMLAMQEDNARVAAAAAPAAPAANIASFAPAPAEPDIPVVPGLKLAGQGAAAPAATGAADLPRLPTFASGPSAGLPQLPANGAAAAPKAAPISAAELPRLQPSAGRTVGVINFAPQPVATPAAANPQTSSLPPQLQSPLVDQVRGMTRSGQRPGVSEETRARFAANAERRRALTAPMAPRLMAQEARWNRDPWPATVNAPRIDPQPPAAPASQVSATAVSTAQASATQAAASDLPRLPTLPQSN